MVSTFADNSYTGSWNPSLGKTTTLNSDIKGFSQSSTNLAQEILQAQSGSSSYSGPTVIRHYHYYNSPWSSYSYFWQPTPVYIIPTRGYSRYEEDNNNALLLGVVAAVVGGIALFTVGTSISTLEDANRELDDTSAFKARFKTYQNIATDAKEREKAAYAENAACLKEQICQRTKNSALTDLILRVGLFVGCAFALMGAILTVPEWMSVGLITSLVFAGAMLFKAGLDSTDKKNFRDARDLQNAINHLNAI